MRIPNYRKRAASAAEKWKRLQLQEQAEKNDFQSEDLPIEKLQKNHSKENPKPLKAVKGIQISEKVIKLRDTA